MRFYHPERIFRWSRRKVICAVSFVLVFGLFWAMRSTPYTVLRSYAGQESGVVFDDELNEDYWTDISYGITHETVTEPLFSGSHALEITHTAGYSSFFMQSPYAISADSVDHVSFQIHGGDTGGQWVKIRLVDEAGEWTDGNIFQIKPDEWQTFELPINHFGDLSQIEAIILQNNTPDPLPSYFVDNLQLVFKGSDGGSGGDDVYQLTVDTWTTNHEISPYIYGVNLVDERMGDELNITVGRYGGNSTSRYNWEISATNLGHDWYFMNVPRGDDPGTLPHGSETDLFVAQNIGTETDTIMTVPMMGWVAKDREVLCGFSVQKYGAQEDTEHWHPDCGNGVLAEKNGGDGYIRTADPTDTNLAIDETFVTDWIHHLTSKFGTAENGGVKFYSMDNEPMLWSHNHRDAHPEHTTYAEVRDKTYQYASAVKQADSGAKVLGPAVWGWPAYYYSSADLNSSEGDIDRMAHGDTPFLEWYLQQMSLYEAEHGTRILDYLDLHYYPQAEGVTLTTAGDLATQQRRLRTTRSLWDPNYGDESWILEPVYLIPRMHDWVNRNYPATQLSVSEYNFGGLEHINGAVTQADVLGIFGRENLHMATLWGWLDIDAEQPWAYAFRMFRNYDGQKSAFGDISLSAISENEWDVSIFAARRSADNALTVIIVNKRFDEAEIDLELDHLSGADFAELYQYSDSNLNEIQNLGPQRVFDNRISAVLPAQSISLFVLEDVEYIQPTITPTPLPKSTPVISDDPIPNLPAEPTPTTNPTFRQTLNHEQSHVLQYEWLNVRVPANTFAEDVYFEIEIETLGRHPEGGLQDLLLGNQQVQFEMSAFTTADAQSIQMEPATSVTVELVLNEEGANMLRQGTLVLLAENQEAETWQPVELSVAKNNPQILSFSVNDLTKWTLKFSEQTVFLPLIKR